MATFTEQLLSSEKPDKLTCHLCRKVFFGDESDCDFVEIDWFDSIDIAPICPECAEKRGN
jgi:hypothetical protein